MNLDEYKASKYKKNPGVDALERWNNRIVPRKLHMAGYSGGRQYISDYGSAMGAPKTIALALQCDLMGAHETAQAFWEHAAKLEGVTISYVGIISTKDAYISARPITLRNTDPNFPPDMQPGTIASMQPSDTNHNREYYITHPSYWAQGKRDGHKLIVFGSPNCAYYQSRSTKMKSAPNAEFDDAIRLCAIRRGSFIIEGELYFLDAAGGEHKTAPQAATANVEMGRGSVAPVMKYMPFVCLYNGVWDMRPKSYSERILWAATIAEELNDILPGVFEICKTYRTETQKRDLVKVQMSEGREGEIWFLADRSYESGKVRDDSIVRTKYMETLEYIITGLTPTTAAGRLFGAIEIVNLANFPVGSIGTGFDRPTQEKIVRLHKTGKPVHVMVTHQGFSERGQLVHARLEDVIE
jgi:bifunctional non-homologous end joining protein LigD